MTLNAAGHGLTAPQAPQVLEDPEIPAPHFGQELWFIFAARVILSGLG